MSLPQQPKTDPTNPTAQLAAQICAITFDTLDQTTVSTVKRLITDGIAVAIAGSRKPRLRSWHSTFVIWPAGKRFGLGFWL